MNYVVSGKDKVQHVGNCLTFVGEQQRDKTTENKKRFACLCSLINEILFCIYCNECGSDAGQHYCIIFLLMVTQQVSKIKRINCLTQS